MKVNELDRVLPIIMTTTDLPEYGLKAGDIGTAVSVHDQHQGYEIEFVSLDGETVAVVSLTATQIRPIGRKEIAHARPLTT